MWKYLGNHPTLPILIVSALLAFFSLRIQRKLARAKNSIDLQNNYLASERMHALMVNVAAVAKHKDAKWLAELAEIDTLDGQPEDKVKAIKDIRIVLNAFERVSIGVDSKVYDEKLLFRSYRGFVIDTHTKLYPYIKEKQEDGRYYNHFCQMAERWCELDKEKQEPVYFWSIKGMIRVVAKKFKNWLRC